MISSPYIMPWKILTCASLQITMMWNSSMSSLFPIGSCSRQMKTFFYYYYRGLSREGKTHCGPIRLLWIKQIILTFLKNQILKLYAEKTVLWFISSQTENIFFCIYITRLIVCAKISNLIECEPVVNPSRKESQVQIRKKGTSAD